MGVSVCVRVCMCVCACVCICVYAHIRIHTDTRRHVYMCIPRDMYTYVCKYTRTHKTRSGGRGRARSSRAKPAQSCSPRSRAATGRSH